MLSIFWLHISVGSVIVQQNKNDEIINKKVKKKKHDLGQMCTV